MLSTIPLDLPLYQIPQYKQNIQTSLSQEHTAWTDGTP